MGNKRSKKIGKGKRCSKVSKASIRAHQARKNRELREASGEISTSTAVCPSVNSTTRPDASVVNIDNASGRTMYGLPVYSIPLRNNGCTCSTTNKTLPIFASGIAKRIDVSSAAAIPSTSSLNFVEPTVQSTFAVTSHTTLEDPLFVACPSPDFVDVSTNLEPDLHGSPAWTPTEETAPALKSPEIDDVEPDLDRLFSSYMCNNGVLTLTGITMSVFRLLLSLLPPVFRSHGLSKENCLLIFLLQMRTGVASYTVETLFCIPRAMEATNIFHTCLSHLKENIQQFIVWPDKNTVNATMPDLFHDNFARYRVILYCLEVRLEPPNWSDLKSGWYKSPSERYRKIIIGFTPSGTISFVSKVFPGDLTLSNVILSSGILDLVEPRDGVFVALDDEQRKEIDWKILGADSRSKCISVLMPNHSDRSTSKNATIWAHAMHQVRRLKSYKILYNFSWELRETVESVVNMACVLANLQPL